ncbi:MAG TPA: alpha/beta fold hydrolase [Fluviicoccus sp.]|nr:alpha/beta fold hydrolase [Fluviicoccus sp.]
MTRPTLVLLAGWGASAAVWQPLQEVVSSRFDIITLDLLDEPADSASLIACLPRLRDKVPGPAVWLGWSLGGLVASALAQLYPEAVSRLLLVAVNPCFVQRPDYASAMSVGEFRDFRQGFAASPEAAWRRFQALQCLGSATARADLRQLQALCGNTLPADPARLEYQLDWLEHGDIRMLPDRLTCPAAWLGGGRDHLVPATAGFAAYPDAEIFNDSAHLPFLSEPERFGQWVCRKSGVEQP